MIYITPLFTHNDVHHLLLYCRAVSRGGLFGFCNPPCSKRSTALIEGGNPGTVVKAACLKSRTLRVRTPLWPSKFKNKIFLPLSLVKIQYCGEPPSPRGSVLGLRPPRGQCHLTQLTILKRFSWPSLAYMCL